MPNVLLFHCPNCDTIEPFKFHRTRNRLDGCHIKQGRELLKVVCASCKHEEEIYFNVGSIPEWILDNRKVYNKIWNGEKYIELD
ncbi:hypothetical protein J6TS7_57870 [Paenibacillus dendritiformis]|nr:hypothetical protein J6TS7_57870 [Paenibacillus dendritiformis]